MKNLKTILLGLFAIISSVEMNCSADDYNGNYAEDAVVQIQALGDGQFMSQLTPEQKAAIKANLLSKLSSAQSTSTQSTSTGVTTQSMESDNNTSDEDAGIAQAMKDAGMADDYAVIQAMEEPEVKHAAEELKASIPPAPTPPTIAKVEEIKAPAPQAAPAVIPTLS